MPPRKGGTGTLFFMTVVEMCATWEQIEFFKEEIHFCVCDIDGLFPEPLLLCGSTEAEWGMLTGGRSEEDQQELPSGCDEGGGIRGARNPGDRRNLSGLTHEGHRLSWHGMAWHGNRWKGDA
jgi:hypothetical protein